jgi:hypothetical protein
LGTSRDGNIPHTPDYFAVVFWLDRGAGGIIRSQAAVSFAGVAGMGAKQ